MQEVTYAGSSTPPEAMTAALIRKCPKCKEPYVKADGCNYITCVRLRVFFSSMADFDLRVLLSQTVTLFRATCVESLGLHILDLTGNRQEVSIVSTSIECTCC